MIKTRKGVLDLMQPQCSFSCGALRRANGGEEETTLDADASAGSLGSEVGRHVDVVAALV